MTFKDDKILQVNKVNSGSIVDCNHIDVYLKPGEQELYLIERVIMFKNQTLGEKTLVQLQSQNPEAVDTRIEIAIKSNPLTFSTDQA